VKLGVGVFGISTQSTEFQQEFVTRMHLPYPLISDVEFALTTRLVLPTFMFNNMRLIKRMAWYCEGGRIEHVFYPVFPPDQNARVVIDWLKIRTTMY
jgi:peroxiredoxin